MRVMVWGLLLGAAGVYSQPQGLQVESGSASLTALENGLRIEASDRAIFNWESFSIRAGERVEFLQNSNLSAVLNRVLGDEASQILGNLESNGQVYLLNPNGICIGPNAVIDTAGFIGSTLHMASEDFLEGRVDLFSGSSNAAIENFGLIRVRAGDVLLRASRIVNQGAIEGQRVELQVVQDGDQGVFVCPAAALVNEGSIEALNVALQADGVQGLAINHKGIIQAGQVHSEGGRVFLKASSGTTQVSGAIQALGGRVHVLGERVHLLEKSQIDVSHETSPGEILIGGDRGGKNPEIQNARFVWGAQDSFLKADATLDGDGGKVILWADEATHQWGRISIRGAGNGSGGFAEVSAPSLLYKGTTDGRAPSGKMGKLLLDPNDVEIGNMATTNVFSGCGLPPSEYLFNDPTPVNQILNTDLEAQLALCDVIVDTNTSGGAGPDGGSITVSETISWVGPTTLQLEATTDVNINNSITLDAGELIIIAGGDIDIAASLFTNDGDVSLSAAGDVTFTMGGLVLNSTGAGDITISADQDINVPNSLLPDAQGSGVIQLQATNNITFSDALLVDGGTFGAVAGMDITVGTQVSCFTAAASVNFTAGNDIIFPVPTSFTALTDNWVWDAGQDIDIQDTLTVAGSGVEEIQLQATNTITMLNTIDATDVTLNMLATVDIVMPGAVDGMNATMQFQADQNLSFPNATTLTINASDVTFIGDTGLDVQDTFTVNGTGVNTVTLQSQATITALNDISVTDAEFNALADVDLILPGVIASVGSELTFEAGQNLEFPNPVIITLTTEDVYFDAGATLDVQNQVQVFGTNQGQVEFYSEDQILFQDNIVVNSADFFAEAEGNLQISGDVNTAGSHIQIEAGGLLSFLFPSVLSGTTEDLLFSGNAGVTITGAIQTSAGGNYGVEIFSGGGNISIGNSLTVQHNGDFFVTANGNITLNGNLIPNTGLLELEAGGNVTINSPLTIGNGAASGTVNVSAGNNFLINNPLGFNGPVGANSTIYAGNNLVISATVAGSNSRNITLQSGANIQVGAGVSSANGNLLLLAGNSFTATTVQTVQTTGTGTLTVVADNNAPNAPNVGNGFINVPLTFVFATAGANLRLYSSIPSITVLPTMINGFAVPGIYSTIGVYYPSGTGGVPFAIFYKAQISTPEQEVIETTNAGVNETLNPSIPPPPDTITSIDGLPTQNPAPCQGS